MDYRKRVPSRADSAAPLTVEDVKKLREITHEVNVLIADTGAKSEE